MTGMVGIGSNKKIYCYEIDLKVLNETVVSVRPTNECIDKYR
jgi:hypothetical protein